MSNLTLPAGPTVGTHKVLALPVVEQGQVFHDADMSKLAPFLQSQGFDVAINFYDEASHGLLTLSYDLFGWNAGPPGPPLQMPVKTRSFFNPPFVAGGLRSTTTAASATIDGTESLVIRVDSRLADRKGKQLTVPFAALVATVSLGPFPVDITFSGTESCAFDVTKGGQTKHVSLQFTAKPITITTAAEFASLGTYLDGIMNTALTKAGMPGVFAPFSVKRSAENPNLVGSIFILLAFNPGGADKGVIANFATSGLSQIGLDTATTGTFAFPGDTGSLQVHLARLLTVSQADAGFASDPLLQRTLKISASGSTITIDINLSDKDGGEMASIALISQAGLEALGFDKAAPNPGGTSSSDWANAINDAQGLVNDAFSAALARIGGNADDALNIFGGYNSIMVVFIESPGPAVPAAQQWSVDPVDYSNLRGLFINAQAFDATSISTTLTCGWIISLFDDKGTPNPALMSHETGHSLGYPDLYLTAEYRRDLLYVNNWSVMSYHLPMPHHCGAIKVHSGWIGGDKGPDGKLSRVVYVATPTPSGPTATEALLVPNEYWDTGMETAVQAAFPGVTAKVAQLVHIDLGGDGNQFDIIEARQKGVAFSQLLPASPALIAMNVLDFEDDTRYAVDGKYRRKVQQLNTGFDLVKKGDSFDFASAPALQAAGVSVTILDVVGVTRPAGVVQVFHVRVDRQAADYIDLAFTQTTPYYLCPDVWVDWAGDNPAKQEDPANHDQYPVGMPLDQGDAVRVPKTGTELHWAVARVWNLGTIPALNVEVIVYKCDPPGSGDRGQFNQFGSDIIPQIDPQQPVDLPIAWNVGPNDSGHTCILAEIADWTLPDKPGTIIALGSDDLTLSNNHGQKNVSTFVSASASPYPPIDFAYSVSNDGLYLERAYLLPDWLPPGLTLHVWPNLMLIPAKSIGVFKCRFEFDSELLGRYCKTDPSVVISAWRRTPESCERWGSVKYDINLRTATATTLSVFYPSSVMVSGVVAPDPGGGQVRIRIEFQGQAPDWFTAPLVSGAFQLTVPGGANDTVQAIAMYDGSTIYAPSSSPAANATRVEIK
jgi:M6 family metalloprotease-like protein